nr:MAG: putative RNA-dependent RNA polymerase [Mitoviridae sp.]
MTTFILVIITLFLSLIHEWNLEWLVVKLVGFPSIYYHLFIILLVISRVVIFLFRKRWFFRVLIHRVSRWIDDGDPKGPGSSSVPNKGNQTRSYSTSVRKPRVQVSVSQAVKTARKEALSLLPPTVKKAVKGLLELKGVKGLFATIAESGSMVSLDIPFGFASAHPSKAEAIAAAAVLEKSGLRTKVRPAFSKTNSWVVLKQTQSGVSDLIRGFGWRVISAAFPGRVKFAGRLRLLAIFSGYIIRVYRTNGSSQVVKYLKASQLAVQKSIGKDHIDSLRDLDKSVVRSKLSGYGLPVIIPSRDRKLIAGGSPTIIRFWLTLFSIYRVIAIPGKLGLETIVEDLTAKIDSYQSVVQQYTEFLHSATVTSMFDTKILERPAELLFLETASSTRKVSWTGLFSDPSILKIHGLDLYLEKLLGILKQDELTTLFRALKTMGHFDDLRDALPFTTGAGIYSAATIANPEGVFPGKLSIKKEAAGKLRVFAMVTVWCQIALKPLHDMLFTFLKSLPNDGTFDQHASEMRCRHLAKSYGHSFGYDLKAATDRLPLEIQAALLDLVRPGLGSTWSVFLTKRPYYLYLPEEACKEHGIPTGKREIAAMEQRKGKVPNEISYGGKAIPVYYNGKGVPWIQVHYAVGQPMGALSSWAMLAVTHHLIVQLAYRRAYNINPLIPLNMETWYADYEVLGDDIIIFDELVAKEYMKLMELFGVPINTSKSVCATVPVTDFAKVTSYYGLNVSALSWRMFMSGNSLMGRANIIFALLSKGVITKNIIPWVLRTSLPGPNSPGHAVPTLIALWTMLSNCNRITVEDALKALIDGKVKTFNFANAILLNADVNKIKAALPALFRGESPTFVEKRSVDPIWKIEKPWFKITLWKPLAVFLARRDVHEDARALTKLIFNRVGPTVGIASSETNGVDYSTLILNMGDFYTDGAPDLNKIGAVPTEDDIEVNDARVLFASLHRHILEKLENLAGEEKVNIGNADIETDLPVLLESNRRVSRYREFQELELRAHNKLDLELEAKPARVLRATDLKLLSILSKMGNRPRFTTAEAILA